MKNIFIGLIALIAAPLSATSVSDAEWINHASADGMLVADVPCSSERMTELESLPVSADAPLRTAPQTRIVCRYLGLQFLAFSTSISPEVLGGRKAFDLVLQSTKEQDLAESETRTTQLLGRRALDKLEESEGRAARIALVELSDDECLVVLAGGKVPDGVEQAEVETMVNRFFSSLEIRR